MASSPPAPPASPTEAPPRSLGHEAAPDAAPASPWAEDSGDRLPLSPAYQPPTHGQLGLLLAYLGAGLLLAVLGTALEGQGAGAAWQLGLFLCCHAIIVTASWLPPQLLSRRLDAWLDRWVADVGGGFYGLMALSTFVGLECASLVDDLRGFELSLGQLVSALLPWLLGFSLESVVNSLKAIAWPVFLLSGAGGAGAFATAAIAWGLFAAGARVFPQPAFMTAKRPRRPRPPRGS